MSRYRRVRRAWYHDSDYQRAGAVVFFVAMTAFFIYLDLGV